MAEPENDWTPRPLTGEEKKQRSQRNLAVALALGAFIVIVFFVTIFRLGSALSG